MSFNMDCRFLLVDICGFSNRASNHTFSLLFSRASGLGHFRRLKLRPDLAILGTLQAMDQPGSITDHRPRSMTLRMDQSAEKIALEFSRVVSCAPTYCHHAAIPWSGLPLCHLGTVDNHVHRQTVLPGFLPNLCPKSDNRATANAIGMFWHGAVPGATLFLRGIHPTYLVGTQIRTYFDHYPLPFQRMAIRVYSSSMYPDNRENTAFS